MSMIVIALLSCWIFGVCISGYLAPNILVFICSVLPLFLLLLWGLARGIPTDSQANNRKMAAAVFLCVLVSVTGACYQGDREKALCRRAVSFCETKPSVLEGVIVSDVSRYNGTDYCYLKLTNGLKAHIKIRTAEPLICGQRVRLAEPVLLAVNIQNREIARTNTLLGNGASLSATFPYRSNYQVVGIGNPLLYYAKQMRNRAKDTLSTLFSRDVAAFLTALISSDKSALKDALYQSFLDTGTVHIVVVSGMHFNYLAVLFLSLLGMVCPGRRRRLLFCFPLLLLFCLFTGGTLPVLRAFFMITAVFLCDWFYLKRQSSCMVILFLAAIFLLVQPCLIYQPSFLLSFGAALGLACFYEILEAWLQRIPWAFIRSYLAAYFAVQVFTLPTICFFFLRIPVVSLAANFLVGPLVAPILFLCIPALLLSKVPLISALLIGATEQLSRIFLFLITHMATWLPPLLVSLPAVSYLCLLGGGMSGYFVLCAKGRERLLPLAVTAFFLVSAVFLPLLPQREQQLLITFMGASNTDSAVITTKNRHLILIGTAEDIFYAQHTAAYRESSQIPLVILTGVSQKEHLETFLSAHRVGIILAPARYQEMLQDEAHIQYLNRSTHVQIDGIDICLTADQNQLYEAEFTYENQRFSFCCDAVYLEKLLKTNPTKTIFFNFKRTSSAAKRIGTLTLRTPLYSKKAWHPKSIPYDNYSIFIADAGGIHAPPAAEREPLWISKP